MSIYNVAGIQPPLASSFFDNHDQESALGSNSHIFAGNQFTSHSQQTSSVSGMNAYLNMYSTQHPSSMYGAEFNSNDGSGKPSMSMMEQEAFMQPSVSQFIPHQSFLPGIGVFTQYG